MKVLITGVRDFDDFMLLTETLNRLHGESPFACLIHGAAKGADCLAGQWAQNNAVVESQHLPCSRHQTVKSAVASAGY